MAYSKPYAIKRWGVHFNGILEAEFPLKGDATAYRAGQILRGRGKEFFEIKELPVSEEQIAEAVRLLKEEFHAKMEDDPKGHFKEFGEIADFEYKDGTLTAYAYGKAYGKSYTRTTEVVADILEQLERLSRDKCSKNEKGAMMLQSEFNKASLSVKKIILIEDFD